MFGLIADDTLYLKTDERNRPRFEAAGMPPFSYETESGRNIIMSYSEVPPAAMMAPAELVDWAEGAVAAARRSRAGKAKHEAKRRSVRRPSG
jgi:DNA transformation protein